MASFTKPKMEKKYINSLSKLEKVHIKAIKDAFNSIQKQEMKKKEEEDYKKRKDDVSMDFGNACMAYYPAWTYLSGKIYNLPVV